MRIGVLGVGRIGALQARTLAAHLLVDRLVIADVDTGRAEHRSVAVREVG